MSKLYYDHLIIFEEIEVELDKLDLDLDEKKELENLIEEIIHHRVMDRVLTHLPKTYHQEFLEHFQKAPHDPQLIQYLDEKIEDSVEKHIREELDKVKEELLADIRQEKQN